ncbi:hypothetical protein IFM89_002760 [Coptis chinensis]|uniref:Uncharacterized protein n=1 Tax=Coptis chinensis TaxID=261450 RepID=A0A835HNF6_9MAGN|nr:hypothetical protein IFM89_002760 [Coptis chinensis]
MRSRERNATFAPVTSDYHKAKVLFVSIAFSPPDSQLKLKASYCNRKSTAILVYHFNALIKLALSEDAGNREVISKQCEYPVSILPELHWGEIASSGTHSNDVLEQSNNYVQVGASTKVALQVESSVAKRSTPERGDILIDINDRFSQDFLLDIFSKERLTEDSSSISPLYSDGTGLSMNMENHDPKHWSFFQKLAQDEFVRNDVFLMDQDHLGYSSPLTKVKIMFDIILSYLNEISSLKNLLMLGCFC